MRLTCAKIFLDRRHEHNGHNRPLQKLAVFNFNELSVNRLNSKKLEQYKIRSYFKLPIRLYACANLKVINRRNRQFTSFMLSGLQS